MAVRSHELACQIEAAQQMRAPPATISLSPSRRESPVWPRSTVEVRPSEGGPTPAGERPAAASNDRRSVLAVNSPTTPSHARAQLV